MGLCFLSKASSTFCSQPVAYLILCHYGQHPNYKCQTFPIKSSNHHQQVILVEIIQQFRSKSATFRLFSPRYRGDLQWWYFLTHKMFFLFAKITNKIFINVTSNPPMKFILCTLCISIPPNNFAIILLLYITDTKGYDTACQ